MEDLRAIYQGADLFVFPSLQEGFGIPPLEAMASGVPVVASRSTSIPDVVGDAAILFDPFDVNDMKRAIQEGLHAADKRSMLIERGRERVKHFLGDVSARKYLEIYERIVSL